MSRVIRLAVIPGDGIGPEIVAAAEALKTWMEAMPTGIEGRRQMPNFPLTDQEYRELSDFLLWQSAHSEFYFVEALGPDLRQVDFLRAIRDYADRDRRFGGLKPSGVMVAA